MEEFRCPAPQLFNDQPPYLVEGASPGPSPSGANLPFWLQVSEGVRYPKKSSIFSLKKLGSYQAHIPCSHIYLFHVGILNPPYFYISPSNLYNFSLVPQTLLATSNQDYY